MISRRQFLRRAAPLGLGLGLVAATPRRARADLRRLRGFQRDRAIVLTPTAPINYRNNFSGSLGFKFTTGTAPPTVRKLGRWVRQIGRAHV
jgi:hypothetical protein